MILYLIYLSLVTFSRRYRAVLRACLLTFKKDYTDVYHTQSDEYNQVSVVTVSSRTDMKSRIYLPIKIMHHFTDKITQFH
jgi:hypothetical protein